MKNHAPKNPPNGCSWGAPGIIPKPPYAPLSYNFKK